MSISFNCSDTAMSRPFPHSCEQRHQRRGMGGQNTVICMKLSTRASTSFFYVWLLVWNCGKGLLGKKVMIFVFLHLCFLSPISRQNSSARFLAFSYLRNQGTQGEIGPGNRAHMKTPSNIFELNIYHHYQYQIKGWPNKTINKTYWERLFTLTAMLLYVTPRNITGTSLVTLF